ncbi:DUF3341 domain-containing protein [bacterium]|nr:DUF3341 domain-containing protein [bacterium]
MAQDSNNSEPKQIGLLVQFDDPDSLLVACDKVRKAGYTKTDAYTPFPLHGIDEALGIKPTKLPWIVLTLGIIGGTVGLLLQYTTNAEFYPFIISAKPRFSLPANIPVIFELTILHSAFAVFFGMLLLNKLPMFSNPLFRVPEFARATDDKFFLAIDVTDDKYKPNKTKEMFEGFVGQTGVIDVFEDPSPNELPVVIKYIGICLAVAAIIPPLILWSALNSTSGAPRINPIRDMDIQLRADTQTQSTEFQGRPSVFPDGRAMRPRIPGTVARGEWTDPVLLTGIVPETAEKNVIFLQDEEPAKENAEKPAEEPKAEDKPAADKPAEEKPADAKPMDEKPADAKPEEAKPEEGAAPTPPAEPEPNWVKFVPIEVTSETIKRGQNRFNIYCSVCHGYAGEGDGLVSRRAFELIDQATPGMAWLPPTNLHTDAVIQQPDGKIFHTITHGIRKMKGYGDQIPPEDRWAIVTYVRALQKTRTGTPDEIPAIKMKELELKGQ